MSQPTTTARRPKAGLIVLIILVAAALAAVVHFRGRSGSAATAPTLPAPAVEYKPRTSYDFTGFGLVIDNTEPWDAKATLAEIAAAWKGSGYRGVEEADATLASGPSPGERMKAYFVKAGLLNWEGEPDKAYRVLEQARAAVEANPPLAGELLYTIIFSQGVTALRRGETDNCVMCRGESSCILPIAPAAVHTRPTGSRLAVQHFTEYLKRFPDDLEVRWLLNVAHMTLGEYPHGVDPAYLVPLDRWVKSEFDIGKFRDIGHLAGVNKFNQGGGGVMDDFDNDGLLDIVCTSFDPAMPMSLFRNKGDGTFEDVAERAGLTGQLGGLNAVQADYNNDGRLDLFVIRGAWVKAPIRCSLLRNNGDGTFTDVTEAAGMLTPVNSNCAAWADFDNDGLLDLYVCCERQPNKLYRNKGDGTFEEVAAKAGVAGNGEYCKACAWVDYDNDGYPDLFVNNLFAGDQAGTARLYHNNRDGTFTDVTKEMGIDGPKSGFSCWAFDFDNDGYLDIWATSYDRSVADVVKGLTGVPHSKASNKLYRNLGGKGFRDVTKEAGLDLVFATMGCNYGDFDNDGYLDFYLGTGDPNLSMLIPARMFKNVGGKRFADVSVSSGTAHLQKGHGTACGDWDRDGNVDLFLEMGGAVPGDRYHNVLFQNPGHDNRWLTVKLVGAKTNRSAIGARIKVVTAGAEPLTVHRHVSSGSSFGGNPLQQTIGLGKADRVAAVEVYWPTNRTTQVFQDVAVNQAIEVTEFAAGYKKLDWKPIPVPK
jgi:hypothetical protein